MTSVLKADPSIGIRHGSLGDHYQLGRVIGQGAHGAAILATRIEDSEEVVVKQIRLDGMDAKAREEALKEVRLLHQFDHVNIVHYYEAVLEVRVACVTRPRAGASLLVWAANPAMHHTTLGSTIQC
jgi:serine/threonine protein kinase